MLAHGQSHVHQHIDVHAEYRQKCPMKNDCDILIVGGGLSGPILALALAQTGLKVVVVDALHAGAAPREERHQVALDALAAVEQRLRRHVQHAHVRVAHAVPLEQPAHRRQRHRDGVLVRVASAQPV